jgi:hypothetical protein
MVAVDEAVAPKGALAALHVMTFAPEMLFWAVSLPLVRVKPTSESPKFCELGETDQMAAALAGAPSSASRAMTEVADTNDAFIKTPRSFRNYNASPG